LKHSKSLTAAHISALPVVDEETEGLVADSMVCNKKFALLNNRDVDTCLVVIAIAAREKKRE